jgi:superfamily II RNA helicase
MNTSDELIATEILFFNVLEPLNPPEVVALLSALVFQVRSFLLVRLSLTPVSVYVTAGKE